MNISGNGLKIERVKTRDHTMIQIYNNNVNFRCTSMKIVFLLESQVSIQTALTLFKPSATNNKTKLIVTISNKIIFAFYSRKCLCNKIWWRRSKITKREKKKELNCFCWQRCNVTPSRLTPLLATIKELWFSHLIRSWYHDDDEKSSVDRKESQFQLSIQPKRQTNKH